MFIKYINSKGVIKYLNSIDSDNDSILEETKFSSTQNPHRDFMYAFDSVGQFIANKYFNELFDKIQIEEISLEYINTEDKVAVKYFSCKYNLFFIKEDAPNLVVGSVVIKKQLVDDIGLLNLIESLIDETKLFIKGKATIGNLFDAFNISIAS